MMFDFSMAALHAVNTREVIFVPYFRVRAQENTKISATNKSLQEKLIPRQII